MNLTKWAEVGDILSGVGSILAVIVVVWQLSRWRHERRHEKRSEVAAEALVALHSACDACHDWAAEISEEAATVLGNPGFTHGETYTRLEHGFERGRADAERPLREARLSETRALAHLESAEIKPLEDVRSCARQVDLFFKDAMVAMRHGMKSREQAMDDLQTSLGQLATRIENARKDGTARLTRAARLEASPQS